MYNYKPGNECFGLKECKEGLYHSNEFLELEKFLMGIVDEEEHYNTDIIGSPSTVDSVTQYPQISKIENKQSLVINRKKTDKFMLSSVLKNNWADSAVRFKFEVFDRILNEKKVKSNAPIKKSISSFNNSPYLQANGYNQSPNQFVNNNLNLYQLN